MGHTLYVVRYCIKLIPSLLQWTTSPSQHAIPQSEIILTRVLENYQIQYSSRISIPIRIFRTKAKTLALFQYIPSPSPSSTTTRDNRTEDIAYLFLEDKSFDQVEEESKDNNAEPKSDEAEVVVGDGGGGAEDDGDIQIIEPSSVKSEGENHQVDDEKEKEKEKNTERDREATDRETGERGLKRKRKQFQTLAVRPASAVVPMLQNLLNPFVMGVTKSARQAASTTAEKATPTALNGTTTTISSYIFPPLPEPNAPITLTLHTTNPNQNSTNQGQGQGRHTILEAEYTGHLSDIKVVEEILKEFLNGCIPDGGGGEYKWVMWDDEDSSEEWEGTERVRKVTQMLGRCMRESSAL